MNVEGRLRAEAKKDLIRKHGQESGCNRVNRVPASNSGSLTVMFGGVPIIYG